MMLYSNEAITSLKKSHAVKNRYSLITRMSRAIEGFDKSTVEPFVVPGAPAPPPPTAAQIAADADPRARMLTPAPAASNSQINQERFRREAADVSQEKNNFANSQLSLYAFLNIVGVGLIIYIAGASR